MKAWFRDINWLVVAPTVTAIVIVILLFYFAFFGPPRTYRDATDDILHEYGAGYFTTVEEWHDNNFGSYRIMYANDTKVMYFLNVGYRSRAITPLYNADGTLQIYQERSEP